MKGTKTAWLVLLIILCLSGIGHSEETSITLPTSDNTSSFNVYNSSPTNIFDVEGTGHVGIRQTNPRAQQIGGYDGLLCTGAPTRERYGPRDRHENALVSEKRGLPGGDGRKQLLGR